MTIWLYSGTPGSGKSLHATRDVRDCLKYKKRPVITNYHLNVPDDWNADYTYIDNRALSVNYLVKYADRYWSEHEFREDYILLVLDECQLLWNSREWERSDRMEWLEFFSQHRKYGYKIIFIAQFDKMVDRQIRALIEYECNHRRVGNYGKIGAVVSFLFGNLFLAVQYYYPLGQLVGRDWFRYSKKVSALYDSYARFEQQQPDGGATAREGARGTLRAAAVPLAVGA